MQISSHPRTSGLAIALLGLAILLWHYRYAGIQQDSVLYLGQSLMRRWPEIFRHDLFFAHGSQERYTLFPWLVSLTFGAIAPVSVFKWGALVGLIAFAAASGWSLRQLLPDDRQAQLWAWLAVLALPSSYGVVAIFGYHQPFLTPRPVAETLCVLAAGLVALRRARWAMACIALAALFHPLQAVAAAFIIWLRLLMLDRRWLHAGWLVLPVLFAGVAGIAPFDGLFRVMDGIWIQGLLERTPQLFLTAWQPRDWASAALDAVLVWLVWKRAQGEFAAWSGAALLGLIASFAASWLLVDQLHLALPAALQIWRVQWLAHWIAVAAFAVLLLQDVRRRNYARACALLLAAMLIWDFRHPASVLLLPLYVFWERLGLSDNPRLARLLGGLMVAGIGILLAHYLATEWLGFRMAHYRIDTYALDRRLLRFPLLAIGLPLLGVWAWQRSAKPAQYALLALLACLVAVGFWRWDARNGLVRAIEQAAFRSDIFGVAVPPHAQVYWDLEIVTGPWLVLRRASYLSGQQLAGTVFNRATSMDGEARIDRMLPLMDESVSCHDLTRPFAERQACHVSDANMRRACEPRSSPGPDFLVLPFPQPQPAEGEWIVRDPRGGPPIALFRMYRCSTVMQHLNAASPEGTR